MSLRHVSVSTCGIVPRIYELAELNLGITLSISLHAPDNAERSAIMPVNDRWDINELMAACRHYFAKTGRRISFERVRSSVRPSSSLALLRAST